MAEGITGQSLAGLLDLDVESIRKLHNSGILIGSGVRGRYLLAPSVRNYVRHLREIAAGRQGNELNAVDENARLKIAQRRNYDLKNSILEAPRSHMRRSRRHGRASSARSGPQCWPSRARRGSGCSI
jgi:phage terminase Nu1 subunit (DNA packaging protein)